MLELDISDFIYPQRDAISVFKYLSKNKLKIGYIKGDNGDYVEKIIRLDKICRKPSELG